MQKLMSVTKNITKSAFVLGFMLQAGHAMDNEEGGSDKRTPPVKADFQEIMDEASGFVQATVAVNMALATTLVETNSPALPKKYAKKSTGVMRTGDSVEQEIDKAVRIMGLTAEGVEFTLQQLASQMHPTDLQNAAAFLSQSND